MSAHKLPHLWLIGITGVGKSSVGKLAARELQLPFVDLDTEIEKDAGVPIAEIWQDEGEAAFRDRESRMIKHLGSQPSSLIATGGGSVLNEANVDEMKGSGLVIWIRDTVSAVAGRIQRVDSRPVLGDGDVGQRLAELLAERGPIYMRTADGIIDRSGKPKDQLAGEIANFYRNRSNA